MNNLKFFFNQRLQNELLGKIAQVEAAPFRKIDWKAENLTNAKRSGVLILFYENMNQPHIVLIQRIKDSGVHSGQIALPGGKAEKIDSNIIDTALREANEEVGVISEDIDVLGQLSDVYIPVSNYLVSPVIGAIDYTPQFIPQPSEVTAIIEMKVSFLKQALLVPKKITLSSGIKMEVPTFQFQQKTIWGATAVILNELRYLLLEY